MQESKPEGKWRLPRHHDAMGRWAIVAGLIAMSVAVMTASGSLSLKPPGRWYGQDEGRPIQADILYRSGLAIAAGQELGRQGLGVDPEVFLQAGIELYERLALRPENPNSFAMYRLAVIYAQRGNPDEGIRLLERLVHLDEARAPLYLATSAVYDPAAQPPARLRDAEPILEHEGDWVGRRVLADCYVRVGDRVRAARVAGEEARREYVFGTLVGAIALLYGTLGLIGFLVVLRFLYQRIATTAPPARRAPLLPGWSVLDACEVAAALMCAMVFIGLLGGYVADLWTKASGAQWGTATLILLSYVTFCGIAGAVMRYRAGLPVRELLKRLGLAGPPQWKHAGAAVIGYSALVALVVAFALIAHSAGVENTFPATESAMELLQQLDSVPAAILYFLLICVLAPVVEECIFRGYIYAGLRSRLGTPIAVIASSLVFGATHLRLAMGGMAAVACVGMLLSLLYERHRTLWPCIIAHALHNLLAFAVLLFMNI